MNLLTRVALGYAACCFAASGAAIDGQEPTVASEVSELASKIDTQAKADEKSKSTSKIACVELEHEKIKTLAERIENSGQLYKNNDNPIMQELWFLGRYHGQSFDAEGNVGESDGWENRRFRIGSQARFFDKLTLHAQMVSGFDMDPFYNGFTELWSQWAFDDRFLVTIGQQKHRFTHDRNVSSRYLNTLERSMLLNMFNADYTPAVTVAGKSDKFAYYTGIFSNATSADILDSFTNYDSGYSLLASGTWDVKDTINTDEAFWNICYLYSDANQNATNLNRYKDGVSTALILTKGAGSLVSEALLGTRSANGDAIGINIQPGWFFTDKLQLATRYQLAVADENDGLLAQRRYDRAAGLTTGDLYQAGYAGFNYYIAGHRIKLMNGIEYADMNGRDVWTASIAFRIFWGPNSNGPFPMNKMLSQ
ncbi:MAG: porin [Pirellulaceae bacterium]|nr:porin [Pirellulaceae bacterium]